ncbi:uncharacterized protein DUF982 [Neorhizobium sp. R1-B]|jgi:hypothetical protein|uniref:DUF982 domain-containing protein n=1 Tax=Neorhizobium TaxID=1525371 RepID=UPI000CF95ADC|nr:MULTISPECIES: DUF982 domain-containing protein [Neorhizobium]TCV69408.1 uncharacterized protein DUF982 [Neorhizobium sp. S3-V5DH]TDX83650.1 uncharacterized protein DUF982 [Neorhizobium sp. R1-B]
MFDVDWAIPVSVELHGAGDHDLIFCTRDAANCLLEDWPVDDGEHFHQALRTFMLVLDGKAEPEDARDAFVAAAEEAGLVVID